MGCSVAYTSPLVRKDPIILYTYHIQLRKIWQVNHFVYLTNSIVAHGHTKQNGVLFIPTELAEDIILVYIFQFFRNELQI
jgi:hypothetical protein